MLTRRTLLAGTGAGALALTLGAPGSAAAAARAAAPGGTPWTGRTSANGWPIDAAAVGPHRVEGSSATLALRRGAPAAVLLHVARRWHYEIAPLDTGEGGVTGYTAARTVRADFESNYFSGTALALHPAGYPPGGSERLWPQQELIVRDILLDCEGTVSWGGDLTPVTASHFQVAVPPGDATLAGVAARLEGRTGRRTQTAGTVADPGIPARLEKARRRR